MIVGRLIPAGTGLAFHRARKAKEAWGQQERAALLSSERAQRAEEARAEAMSSGDGVM